MIDPHEGSSPNDEAVKMSNYDTEVTAKYVRRKPLFFTTCYHLLVSENVYTSRVPTGDCDRLLFMTRQFFPQFLGDGAVSSVGPPVPNVMSRLQLCIVTIRQL